MLTGAVACVLEVLGVRPGRVAVLKDVPPGNGSWLVELPGGQRAVLRRYYRGSARRIWGGSTRCLVTWPAPDGLSRIRSATRCATTGCGTA